jgi:Fur family ferric uptake transcriptional regulator
MDEKTYKEVQKSFISYLKERKLRKTEERITILEKVCSFPGSFDICKLHEKLSETKFHVSTSTLYNTLEVFIDAGLVIRHQVNNNSVLYELRILAETHLYLICMKCGALREVENSQFRNNTAGLRTSRFTPEFFLLYMYGVCSKCKRKGSKEKK